MKKKKNNCGWIIMQGWFLNINSTALSWNIFYTFIMFQPYSLGVKIAFNDYVQFSFAMKQIN